MRQVRTDSGCTFLVARTGCQILILVSRSRYWRSAVTSPVVGRRSRDYRAQGRYTSLSIDRWCDGPTKAAPPCVTLVSQQHSVRLPDIKGGIHSAVQAPFTSTTGHQAWRRKNVWKDLISGDRAMSKSETGVLKRFSLHASVPMWKCGTQSYEYDRCQRKLLALQKAQSGGLTLASAVYIHTLQYSLFDECLCTGVESTPCRFATD